ncbi:iron-containing alcohol dehydrogenase [Ramlibacter sp. WS9]|uniref:iron-containing alcohol dehydrogenase n=1 Tax=Ramlibacter sp. WS9 TaxID=1882741 RepID=UPI0011419ED3|nr:iron-containing alcohol dehydrogenase [Ramlibacter sp. WS9]ROZ68772.1 iron-containing alcohol dehydrogenase [Ramlibacter sp. WS9]
MLPFEFNSTKSIVMERGSAARLAHRLQGMGFQSVLVVTDPGVLAAGLLAATLNGFDAIGLRYALFADVQADPPESVIEAVAAAARRGVDCVVGFGGGSSMDAAKLAALLAASDQPLSQAYGVNQARGPRLPLVLIPTTAGTGSEVTPISIVTTGVGEKKGVVSPLLLPDLALLDAELTTGLPQHVTAATGIDAMVHAIEAYTSKRLKNPVSDCLAREALRLLSANIHTACRDPLDLDAREKMLLGACLAGMAFANAPVAAVHALAYPIGARFHVPHGLSNSLVLAAVFDFNLALAQEEYAELADIVRPRVQGSTAAKAAALSQYLRALPDELSLPTRLRDVGIAESDIAELAEDAMKQTRLLVNNPREVRYQDAVALYMEAL